MAKAQLKTEVKYIELTLSMPEAQTLVDVCEHIGGCPDNSRRKHTDSIRLALIGCGIKVNGSDMEGSVHIESNK